MQKKFSFYLTNQTSQYLDEMQEIMSKTGGRVTKAWLVNQAIKEYYEKHIDELKEELE